MERGYTYVYMTPHYRQLSLEERERMQQALWERKSLRGISRILKRSPATVSRELKRNGSMIGTRRYHPRLAHERTKTMIRTRGQRLRLKHPFVRMYVHTKLRKGWSPEQIAGRLSEDHPYRISHEAIYQYIYAQYRRGGYGVCTGTDLRRYLRRRHRARHPRTVQYAVERGPIANRVSIAARPEEVKSRSVPGHWEGDSVESKKKVGSLNTLVERTSGLVFISKLRDHTSAATAAVVIRRLQRIPRTLRKTLTLDNGPENARHELITERTGANCFFAHPYHFWERGTNENTNGSIRWYLPKGTDLSLVPECVIRDVEYMLNSRPRKRLGWRTPLEVFNSFLLH